MTEIEDQTILEEAQKIVYGRGEEDYGTALDDFTRTGKMWAAILGVEEVKAEEVALCMIVLKISREVNKHKRDNLVDISGYAETINRVWKERKIREEPFSPDYEKVKMHKVEVTDFPKR